MKSEPFFIIKLNKVRKYIFNNYFIVIFVTFLFGCLSGVIACLLLQSPTGIEKSTINVPMGQETIVFSAKQLMDKQLVTGWQNVKYESLVKNNFNDAILFQVDGEQGMHRHNGESHLIYVLSGSGELLTDRKSTLIEPGSLIYIPSGTKHNVKSFQKTPIRGLQFSSPPFDIDKFEWISK